MSKTLLTGDGIAEIADVQVYSPRNRVNSYSKESSQSLSNARVVFCPSHKIDEFFHEFGSILKPEILIFGNSDHDFREFNWKLPETVKTVFLQNSFISDGFFRTLPIGVENIRYGRNGFHFLFSSVFRHLPKKDSVLCGPFSMTHSERLKMNGLMGSYIVKMDKFVSPLRLAWMMSRHKFVLAPRGNGVDTHRLWEALYRGCIPILKRDEWSESIARLSLPVILIDDWNDEDIKIAITLFSGSNFEPKELSALWLSHWEKELGPI